MSATMYDTLQAMIEQDPPASARILRQLGYTVTKKRAPARKKNDCPPDWGPAAWESYQAVRRSKAYGTLDPTNLNAAAQRACEKREEIRPPTGGRFWLRYTEHADSRKAQSAAAVEWGKLGVPHVEFETKEEAARKARIGRARGAALSLEDAVYRLAPDSGGVPSGWPDPHLSTIAEARDVARDLLEHGERGDARTLVAWIRRARRAVLKHYGSLSPHFSKPAHLS